MPSARSTPFGVGSATVRCAPPLPRKLSHLVFLLLPSHQPMHLFFFYYPISPFLQPTLVNPFLSAFSHPGLMARKLTLAQLRQER